MSTYQLYKCLLSFKNAPCTLTLFKDRLCIKTTCENSKIIMENRYFVQDFFLNWKKNQIIPGLHHLTGFSICLGQERLEFTGNSKELEEAKEILNKKFPQEGFQQQYTILQPIKQIEYGKILLVKNILTQQCEVAKFFDTAQNGLSKNMIYEEVKIAQDLAENEHKNVISLRQYFIERKGTYLIFEYCQVPSLYQLIHSQQFAIPLEKAIIIMKCLLKGVSHMHQSGIMHRDLKLDNIVMKSLDNLKSVKIIDFGFSTYLKKIPMIACCGTPGYIAPEIFKNEQYSELCDIFSLSVVFYYILTGKKLFSSNSYKISFVKNQSEDISCMKIDRIKDPLAKDLFCKMSCSQNERLNAQQCLDHELFQKSITTKIRRLTQISMSNPFIQNQKVEVAY